MDEVILKAQEYLVTYGLNLLGGILIFIIGKWASKLVAKVIHKIMLKSKVDPTLAGFVKNLSYIATMVFVCIAALNKIGVQTTSLVAVIGAAGLAVGLALQGSLANFAAGVMLVIFKPFGVGDFIDAGGTMGSVEEIQIFNTILNSPDNRRIIVPNAKVTGDNITNFSAIKRRRIDLTFGISYEDDIKKAKDVLLKIVNDDKRVLKDPAPVVAVAELGDSSVNIICRPWVNPADYWAVYFEVTEKGKIELEANGMSIPYPQRDVHMYSENKEA